MRDLARILFLATGIFFLLAIADSFAGDSVTLSVSCTIPAIPGVNAPSLLQQSNGSSQAEPLAEEGKTKNEEENKDTNYTRLAEEKKEGNEMLLSQAESSSTLYSR